MEAKKSGLQSLDLNNDRVTDFTIQAVYYSGRYCGRPTRRRKSPSR